MAVLAERVGLDGLWLTGPGELLTVRVPQTALSVLAAAAARTTSITLGAYMDRLPGSMPDPLAARLDLATGRCDAVVEMAASVGRTTAEALARVEADPRLRGFRDPRRGGLFGALEDCQARVVELARAGVSEVRCWVPATPDVHDVIAQLAAVRVGTLSPSEQGRRARPPTAPKEWGGRPRRPSAPPLINPSHNYRLK